MTAAPHQIVCANCGAKYKLPADFKAASAKCKACGASIDVAGQISAAKAPPPAAPKAPEKPVRSERATASTRDAKEERSTRRGASSRRGRDKDHGDSDERAGSGRRRGAAPAAKKSNPAVLWGSLVGVVAIVVVGIVLATGGGDDKPTSDAQAAQAQGQGEGSTGAANAAGADKPTTEGDAGTGEAKTEGGTAAAEPPKTEAKAEVKKPEPKEAAAKTEPVEAKPLTMADVFDPKTLDPIEYPDYVDASMREEIKTLCEQLREGGRGGRIAKRRLEEIGHAALAGVINTYQQIDFKDPNQSMFAFEVNKLLTDGFGAGVVSTDFKVTLQGEPIPPETADWNAKSVKAWRRFWEMYSDKERWEKMIASRKEGKEKGEEGK